MDEQTLHDLEVDLLLEGIYRRHGYDFSHYARGSLIRRIEKRLATSGLCHVSEMLPKALHDDAFFDAFLMDMSVTVTEMFRDPPVFLALRERVVPLLKTSPHLKIWHAGCATGEEVYAMAILLEEEGLYDNTQIFATDLNPRSLEIARNGIYSAKSIRQSTDNYQAAGGKASFAGYYHGAYGAGRMNESLRRNVTFAHHNLVSDGSFGEMNLILCRNVLIYFDQTLQNRVLQLFDQSLSTRGLLCLGTSESIRFSDQAQRFEALADHQRIFRKVA